MFDKLITIDWKSHSKNVCDRKTVTHLPSLLGGGPSESWSCVDHVTEDGFSRATGTGFGSLGAREFEPGLDLAHVPVPASSCQLRWNVAEHQILKEIVP